MVNMGVNIKFKIKNLTETNYNLKRNLYLISILIPDDWFDFCC